MSKHLRVSAAVHRRRRRTREGDEMVVWKLDRLGRNTWILPAPIDDLEGRGEHFRSPD